jgi:glycerol-3-phosphate dehydrogenase
MPEPIHDLLIVGGGINGVGIARDAAGRGLSVLLVEQDDLAAHTSSWSTKLIHGGLRYLEHYEFRLVSEALAERDVLLRAAPHLIAPLAFVLPHEPHLRPWWMIRGGLFLYDRLGGRSALPRSAAVRLDGTPWGAGLAPQFRRGFVYSDAQVDDARLVVANAIDARERGARIRTGVRFVSAARADGVWRAQLATPHGEETVAARALVNASGPWVKDVLTQVPQVAVPARVGHVKGSHIVVPRVHAEPHAYILQNADQRIVFVIPWLERYSLIGTTDIAVTEYDHPAISEEETAYLLRLANAYLARPLSRADIVWSYSGVRPLYDDGSADPSAVTRDYVLVRDALPGTPGPARAPILSVFGGKITTYRRLAEHALSELQPFFPQMRGGWTDGAVLPGGDIPGGDRERYVAELQSQLGFLPPQLVRDLVLRHGTRAARILAGVRSRDDLGEDFGAGFTQRELAYLVQHEWARSAQDVLWRRTKCGLSMSAAQRARVEARLGAAEPAIDDAAHARGTGATA